MNIVRAIFGRRDADLDVVVCVHDALDDTRRCVESVSRTRRRAGRLILVDDGSQAPTRAYLEQVAARTPGASLIRHDQARGYTVAANRGMCASTARYVVLLNSDAVLTDGALERMIRCMESSRRIGLVGPLSNAASYQSVPDLVDSDGEWKVNELPSGWGPDDLATVVAATASRTYPKVPILNGFCLMISRTVIDQVGLLDEARFPRGYGEENDYCIRAARKGFRLVVCDDAYVQHAKSRSFGNARRLELSRAAGHKLEELHGKALMKRIVRRLERHRALAGIRTRIGHALASGGAPARPPTAGAGRQASGTGVRPTPGAGVRVLFLLPVKGFSGGAHSVIQEASGMRALGLPVQVAVPRKYRKLHQRGYPGYPPALFHFYRDEDDLLAYAATFQVCVATIFVTVKVLARIVAREPRVLPAYYIQDYEPNFEAADSPLHEEAVRSYELIPGIVAFAKTDWLREQVEMRHSISVAKVVPSIDHRLFADDGSRPETGPVTVCAMVRPKTPRRNAAVTMRVLRRIAERYGEAVRVEIFGATRREPQFKTLERDFAFVNHGVITHRESAELLARAHIFVDFSTYQAFGRTALESMATGCSVVLTREGGVAEFARDEENCLLVDPENEDHMVDAVARLLDNRVLRARLGSAGVETAQGFSIEAAARSEIAVFEQALERAWLRHPVAALAQ